MVLVTLDQCLKDLYGMCAEDPLVNYCCPRFRKTSVNLPTLDARPAGDPPQPMRIRIQIRQVLLFLLQSYNNCLDVPSAIVPPSMPAPARMCCPTWEPAGHRDMLCQQDGGAGEGQILYDSAEGV